MHPNKVRGNSGSYVDYDGDGKLDLVVGVDDWTDYGWDDAYDADGRWTRGPLRGFVYLLRNTGTTDAPTYEPPVKVEAGGKPVEIFGWPSPNFADFDGDGDLDLICGEFLDGFTYFENIGTRTAPEYAAGRRLDDARRPAAGDGPGDDRADGDRLGPGRRPRPDRRRRGRPRGASSRTPASSRDDRTPQFLPPRYFQQEADDLKFGALATPVGFDWDGDGDIDIICGNTAGYIGFFENLSGPGVEQPKWAAPKLLEADGKAIRIMAGPNGSIQGPCEAKWGYTTLSVADWDGDGLPDIVVNSIWGKVALVSQHRHAHGSRSSPPRSRSRSSGTAPQPALAWGWLRPQGKALLTQWRTTPVAVRLERRRAGRPRDARPRGLSRVLRARAARRRARAAAAPTACFVRRARASRCG